MINPYAFPGLKMTGLSKEKYPYITYEKYSVTRDEIVDLVCRECEVTVEQLTSVSRKTEIVNGRKILSAALKIKLNLSLVSIGEMLGGRDHTTIRHALIKFMERYATEENYKTMSEDIFKQLGVSYHNQKLVTINSYK